MIAQATSRVNDPATSSEAAATVDVARDRRAVLMLLAYLGEARDSDLEANMWRVEHGTPQSLRSRRAELMREGYVEVARTDAHSACGRRCRSFKLTRKGLESVERIEAPFYLSEW